MLHSDRATLDPEVREWAREAGIKIRSTAPETKQGTPHDLYVNVFDEPTYFVVKKSITINALAQQRTALPITVAKDISNEELAESISIFTGENSTKLFQRTPP